MVDLENLIRECVKNNRQSQKKLYNLYSSKMFGICLRYSHNREEAEDILQEGFMKVFIGIGKYEGKGSFEGWVRRIMVNTAIEHFRKKKNNLHFDIMSESVIAVYSEDILDNISLEEIMKLVQKMPEGYRMVFNLFAVEGYTHNEISDMLGIEVGTSKSQYSRARMYLQKVLKKINRVITKSDVHVSAR